jgi:hypothetical protein
MCHNIHAQSEIKGISSDWPPPGQGSRGALRLHRLIEYLAAVTAGFDYPLGNLGQLHLAFLR